MYPYAHSILQALTPCPGCPFEPPAPKKVGTSGASMATPSSKEGRVHTPPWNKKTVSRIPSALSTPTKGATEEDAPVKYLPFEVMSPAKRGGRSMGFGTTTTTTATGETTIANKENLANQIRFHQPLMALTMQHVQSTSPAKPRLYSPAAVTAKSAHTAPASTNDRRLCQVVEALAEQCAVALSVVGACRRAQKALK